MALLVVAILSYVSLGLELTVFHVPSVASSWKIWTRPAEVEAAYSTTFRGLFALPRAHKAVLFVLPLVVVVAVFGYPLVTLLGLGDPLGEPLFLRSPTTDAMAIGLIVAGRAVTLGAMLSLRRHVRSSDHVLRTEGLFHYSRNPGLVGMYVFAAGLWLAAPSAITLGGTLVYVLYMDFKVRMEEDYLRGSFGADYVRYQQQTRRYLL